MVQLIKVLAARSDDLSSRPYYHKLPSDLHTCASYIYTYIWPTCRHTYKHTHKFKRAGNVAQW